MKVRRAHFTGMRQLLEELFAQKYPNLLRKTRDSLERIDATIAEMNINLDILSKLVEDHPRATELVAWCVASAAALKRSEKLVFARQRIVERVDVVNQTLHALAVKLHSLEHLEEAASRRWKSQFAAIRASLTRIHEEHSAIAKQLSKHCQVFMYFENLFEGFDTRANALKAEMAVLESQSENYATVLAALASRMGLGVKPNALRVSADWFRQRELATAQLELLLEQPAIFAFEYLRAETQQAGSLPPNFDQIVSHLNAPEFVQTHLLRFPLHDLVHSFRHLFGTVSAVELQKELSPFPYHEESFADLYILYARLSKAIRGSECRDTLALLRDIKDYGGESRSSRDLSDKLFEATWRGLRYERLLGELDRFREHVQTFCMNEFGVVVIVHA